MEPGDKRHEMARVLSEDELKRMSRQAKKVVSNDEPNHDDRIKLYDLFDSIFATASSPSLSATHRVAAWNALCAFIDELARLNADESYDVLWSNGVWRRAFRLFITHSQYARPKSAKQLLVTLGDALRKCDDPFVVHNFITDQTAEYLLNDETPRQTKALLQLLTQLLSKDLISPISINIVLSSDKNDCDVDNPSSSIVSLLTYLFTWASHEDFGSVVGRCLSVILDKHHKSFQNNATSEGSRPPPEPVWASALYTCLQDQSADIEQMRIHIFPILFGRSLSQYTAFLRGHGLERQSGKSSRGDEMGYPNRQEDLRLLHAALLSGKELGLIQEVDGTEVIEDATELCIPLQTYASLLSNLDRDTRIIGLSLLIVSRSATRPFLPRALKLLRMALPAFFADNDANFRSEVFSLVQRLMDRLRSITAVLARTVESAKQKTLPDHGAAKSLQHHREFLDWLLRLIIWELRPTASYQRHISALKSLSIVVRSGIDVSVAPSYWTKSATAETKWPFSVSILQSGLRQMLLDLLMDPFDDVRQTASFILSMFARSSSQVSRTELSRSLEQGEKMMLATGRADQADGVAHMYSLLARTDSESSNTGPSTQSSSSGLVHQLLVDLERMLENAQTSLAAAAKTYPMHGLLTSIRFILSQQSSRIAGDDLNRLIRSLNRVWETVKPVLCNDAPEGFEVEEAGESTEGLGSTKDVLSYCWRALKESSLLLGALVLDKGLDSNCLIGLSDLCFNQLAELRHRGAFSTVAQTWVTCCNRSVDFDSSSSLDKWFERTFDILKNKTTINTRRSAGIPSLLCGLLIADKTDNLLSRAFKDLSNIAEARVDSLLANESSLPQVHALNCIKDILKNTRLGEQSERYVPSALRLAADSLQSEAWAIRNCGLMLFRGVIDRLLGTSDAYLEDDSIAQKRIVAQAHPGLLDIVLQLLALPDRSDHDATPRFEGVFPALQMLQRMALPEDQLERARRAALNLTCCPAWHVRDKAARTYAALVIGDGSVESFAKLLESRVGNHNGIHGALLCIKYAIKNTTAAISRSSRSPLSRPPAADAMLETIVNGVEASRQLQASYIHPVAKATFSDVLVEYMHLRCCLERNDSASIAKKQDASRTPIPDFLRRLQIMSSKSAERAIERAGFARAFALQLALDQSGSVKMTGFSEKAIRTIVQLGHDDSDACTEFWRSLRTGSEGKDYRQTIMLPAAAQVLSRKLQIRLKCEVQGFLLYLADAGYYNDDFTRACTTATSPLVEDSNQEYADQWLQLHALILDSRIEKNTIDTEDLTDFITSCKAAVADSGFYFREAAALALSRMQHIWSLITKSKGSLACDIYFTIYDLLNDDDEDLRLMAAATVSSILRSADPTARTTHFEPITASQRLLEHMLVYLRNERGLAVGAFSRAFTTNETVADLLSQYSRQDTELFAQEKQNLYIDEAREAKAWAQVLLRLPINVIPKPLVRDLAFWVDDGLHTLTSHLSAQARANDDVTLNWTSKSETFVLGLQVIYGVEFLLAYTNKSGRSPVRGSKLLKRLAELQELLARVEGEGPMLWLWECERVSRRVVEGRVGLARRLIGEVRTLTVRDGKKERA